MRRRTVNSMVAAILAAAALVLPTAVAQSPATAAPACAFAPTQVPASAGFAAGQTDQAFATPAPRDHIAILDGFSSISPLVRQQNLAEAVAINNTASPATARAAVNDNYAIEGPAIFDALGSRLAPAFYAALRAGQLPKTAALLLGDESPAGERTGTSKEKKYFQYPRPFEVAPQLIRHYGDGRPDLYAAVRGSGSYPSGHTTWGYTQAFLIAAMLPEEGPQILARGADYGYHRVVLGVHYPLDVIGGRMLAQAVTSEMLGDPRFAGLFAQARTELRAVLQARVGAPIGAIVACQQAAQPTATALTTYRQRATFSFLPSGAAQAENVPAGAENLIRAAHPGLSTAQLRDILARTALPAGYPLDKSGLSGGWQRLDIARAWVTR
ncbi:MAG TPA: phosphatase PAP2 family protein [Gordonia polyisoprenivorans]|uniref:acid phosphatase n=1 Tax=Gordonia polyisoprenivorans TaxID=84595 RepID=A0A846WP39_9ACTN|nr:phosphatase PAP2 family protein [Gordonia polyisoprenivorans]MBE7192713.1 phosphatase PAP2 family protein [Gordonia polyisoprenivorans]NKY02533.1 phosphatase PAP2 family protein [Gordonia polyisoprenivorans]OZC30075.1 phosphatase PAP2 family protein [Gordonia polyisoprenivorans]QUD80939.1 phosphatase PAP2 family protein [Gordonia polyisoprenivorans]UZF58353.1 phosphatase PAP2 family protein [Gordonia polyisoprenivorans]